MSQNHARVAIEGWYYFSTHTRWGSRIRLSNQSTISEWVAQVTGLQCHWGWISGEQNLWGTYTPGPRKWTIANNIGNIERKKSATKRYPDEETHEPKVEPRAKQNSDRGWGGESSNNIFVKYVYLTSRYAWVIHERIPISALNHLIFIPRC